MPATITVAQHVFASLTREQSPTRRPGYQTCLYTHGLITTAAVRELEARTQHRASQGQKGKWQFFWLTSGQAVVSHLSSVPEPDEFGRKGRYLAHSMIVSAADWHQLDSNPFALINAASFTSTMERALALGDLRSGEVGPTCVEVNPAGCRARARSLSEQWPTDELWKLARLACRPLTITSGGQFVAFVGDDQQIREALEVAFLLPPAPRENCSFDTAAAGCSWPRGVSFWGQGFSNEREARTPFVVDAAHKKIRLPHDWLTSVPLTPNEVWLKRLVHSREFSAIQKDQRDISILSAVLEGRTGSRAAALGVAGKVRSSFADDNRAQIEARLNEMFPERLPDYLRDAALTRIGRTPGGRFDWLIMNPAGEGLGEILYGILREWEQPPTEELLLALTPLARGHAGLHLLLSLWSQDWGKIQRSLSAMTAEQYCRHVPELFTRPSCSPRHFMSAKHLHDWFALFVRRGLKLGELVDGISLVVRYGDDKDFEDLTVIAGLIDADNRLHLLKELEKLPDHKRLKSLKAALRQEIPTNPEPAPDGPASGPGLFGRRRDKN
jgi:hypothetical protein